MDPDQMIKQLSEKTDYAELFVSESSSVSVKSVKENIEFISSDSDKYYQVRVFKGKRMGQSSFENPSDFQKAFKFALKMLSHSREYPEMHFPEPVESRRKQVDKKLVELSPAEMAGEVIDLTSFLKGAGVTPTQCGAEKRMRRTELYTTLGHDVINQYSVYSAYANISHLGTEAWEDKSSREYFPASQLHDKILWLAENTCGGKRFSGETVVLLPPETVSELVSAFFVPAIRQYKVITGKSVFKNKVHEAVASPDLSVVDDPGLANGLFSRDYDGEGVRSRKKNIIRKGVLDDFIRDLKSAWLSGKSSTGHASRGVNGVNEYPTNLIFKGPASDTDSFSGVMVRDLLGIHTCNHLTGDMSLEVASGAVMKNGEPESAVKGGVLVANFFDLLKQVELAGKPEVRGHYVGPAWTFKGKII